MTKYDKVDKRKGGENMEKKKAIDYLKDFWRDIVNIEGKITGRDFLITYLLLTLVGILLVVSIIGIILIPIYWLVGLIGIPAMAMRRLNDMGKSRWLIILLFIPFLVNIIFLIYLCCSSSKNKNGEGSKYMKVSNKILVKALFIIILLAFITVIIIFGCVMVYEYDDYKYSIYRTTAEGIKGEYENYLRKGYNWWFGLSDNVSYEVFYAKYMDVYSIRAKYDLLYFRIWLAVEIVTIIAFIPISILIIKYFKRTNKLIRHIKEYRDYMLATNSYKIEDIAKEFNEEPRLIESYIQKAINKHILKNVYLSKQTKEVLLVNKYI